MTNRIPPPNPESTRQSQAQRIQEDKKIEKIREIDADEQTRRRRFQKSMQQVDEEQESTKTSTRKATPLEPDFYRETSFNLENDKKIPNPSYSQPPDVEDLAMQKQDFLSNKELPRSREFWKQVDLPDQPIEQKHNLTSDKVSERKSSQEQEAATKKGTEKSEEKHPSKKKPEIAPFEKSLEPSPFGPPGKLTSEIEAEAKPGARYWELLPELEKKSSSSLEEEKKELEETKTSPLHHPKEKKEKEKGISNELTPLLSKPEIEERQHTEQRPKATIEIVPPTSQSFPVAIHAEAVSATTAASPYLRPEAIPLFYQMVGTIFVMTNQGISTTEILLNNPDFAGSKFYGASIEIIKYATAPDSLNIRMTGTNQAVAAFNQNIPGLMAAFQTGGFSFRIGRIEASYSIDRPVFHRKEEGDFGGNSERERK